MPFSVRKININSSATDGSQVSDPCLFVLLVFNKKRRLRSVEQNPCVGDVFFLSSS